MANSRRRDGDLFVKASGAYSLCDQQKLGLVDTRETTAPEYMILIPTNSQGQAHLPLTGTPTC